VRKYRSGRAWAFAYGFSRFGAGLDCADLASRTYAGLGGGWRAWGLGFAYGFVRGRRCT
jgi:hypothetical protein